MCFYMTIIDEKKYELKLDTTKKVLLAKAFGHFLPADANDFLQEYLTKLKTVVTTQALT